MWLRVLEDSCESRVSILNLPMSCLCPGRKIVTYCERQPLIHERRLLVAIPEIVGYRGRQQHGRSILKDADPIYTMRVQIGHSWLTSVETAGDSSVVAELEDFIRNRCDHSDEMLALRFNCEL